MAGGQVGLRHLSLVVPRHNAVPRKGSIDGGDGPIHSIVVGETHLIGLVDIEH